MYSGLRWLETYQDYKESNFNINEVDLFSAKGLLSIFIVVYI